MTVVEHKDYPSPKFRCRSLAERLKQYDRDDRLTEAQDALLEAAQVIEELEEEVRRLRAPVDEGDGRGRL